MAFISRLIINCFKKTKYLFLSLLFTLIVVINHEVILAASTPSLEIAKSLTQQGFSQLYDGKPEAAFQTWQAAYRAYEQLNNEQGMNGSLINQSLALQALGSYTTACQALTQALSLNNGICPDSLQKQTNFSQLSYLKSTLHQKQINEYFQFIGFYNLANVLRVMGEPEISYVILQQCLTSAVQLQNQKIQDNLLLNLANTEVILYNQAKSKYQLTDDFTAQKKAIILAKSKFVAAQQIYQELSNSQSTVSLQAKLNWLLAWDTPLMVNDLKALLQNKSNLDLLVLSACQTAKGDRRSFLGIAGIAAQAGARGVLASLWLVDADSTAQLMTKFYEGLKSGLTKAEALRSAQLSLLKSDKYFHPYYWSAFILVGG